MIDKNCLIIDGKFRTNFYICSPIYFRIIIEGRLQTQLTAKPEKKVEKRLYNLPLYRFVVSCDHVPQVPKDCFDFARTLVNRALDLQES